jgi:hypothetical protein
MKRLGSGTLPPCELAAAGGVAGAAPPGGGTTPRLGSSALVPIGGLEEPSGGRGSPGGMPGAVWPPPGRGGAGGIPTVIGPVSGAFGGSLAGWTAGGGEVPARGVAGEGDGPPPSKPAGEFSPEPVRGVSGFGLPSPSDGGRPEAVPKGNGFEGRIDPDLSGTVAGAAEGGGVGGPSTTGFGVTPAPLEPSGTTELPPDRTGSRPPGWGLGDGVPVGRVLSPDPTRITPVLGSSLELAAFPDWLCSRPACSFRSSPPAAVSPGGGEPFSRGFVAF